MTTILDKIIAQKKKHIGQFSTLSPVEKFEEKGFFWKIRNRSLVQSLLMPGTNGIIAEFKRKSPSKGWFKPKELEVEKVISYYNQSAAGISVLTDEEFFGGDLDDLIQAKVITDIPVLRKDFIIDKWQVAESKAFGADVILLIAACLTPLQVKELSAYAKSIGLETILEIHQEKELDHYCEDVSMIGINNRDLDTFSVDLEVSLNMIQKLPPGKPAIAESGIHGIEQVSLLRDAGFKGFLIGEMFMKEEFPGRAFEEFIIKLKEEDIS
jgi:indole-3-glycerol phosphate synthase